MQRIQFKHTSSEVYSNVFLKNFFRFVGIYTNERFFDFNEEKEAELLIVNTKDIPINYGQLYHTPSYEPDSFLAKIFDENEQQKKEIDVDMYLYYVSDQEGINYFQNNPEEKNKIEKSGLVLCSSEYTYELQNILNTEIITIDNINNFNVVGKKIIDKMCEKNFISSEERDDLLFCLETYCDKEVWKLSLASTHFSSERQFDNSIVEQYKEIFKEFFNKILEKFGKFGTKDFPHANHMCFYIAFEGDKYSRNKGVAKTILGKSNYNTWCNHLLDIPELSNYSEMFHMLLGRVGHYLYHDLNYAIEHLNSCKDNEYLFGEKARIYEKCEIHRSIKNYSQSLIINPVNYAYWDDLGDCYRRLWEYNRAVWCYYNVLEILESRLKKGAINLVDAFYAYTAWLKIAELRREAKQLGQSVIDYRKAIEIGNLFKNSTFFEQIGDTNTEWWKDFEKTFYRPVTIYDEIIKIADELEDPILKEQTRYQKQLLRQHQ